MLRLSLDFSRLNMLIVKYAWKSENSYWIWLNHIKHSWTKNTHLACFAVVTDSRDILLKIELQIKKYKKTSSCTIFAIIRRKYIDLLNTPIKCTYELSAPSNYRPTRSYQSIFIAPCGRCFAYILPSAFVQTDFSVVLLPKLCR